MIFKVISKRLQCKQNIRYFVDGLCNGFRLYSAVSQVTEYKDFVTRGLHRSASGHRDVKLTCVESG